MAWKSRQASTPDGSWSPSFNLRGNQRTAGEQSRREGGKVFDAGSRATVAITVLVKDPSKAGAATIHYTDIGDYLSREDKLSRVAVAGEVTGLEPVTHVSPNHHGDWFQQRRDDFEAFLPIGHKASGDAVFRVYSGGLKTNRDAWCYNADSARLEDNVQRLIETYEVERAAGRTSGEATTDGSLISWSGSLSGALDRGMQISFDPTRIRDASYRPFEAMHVYFDSKMNERRYQLPSLLPSRASRNMGFYSLNPGAEKPFAVLVVDRIPDVAFYGSNAGQFFARWRYEKVEAGDRMLALDDVSDGEVIDGHRRIDNITDAALGRFRAAYGPSICKDDIFSYVYGLLHSPDYRDTYAADLKKMLPRIPLVTDAEPFIDAGRRLSDLHLGYETVTPYPLAGLDAPAPPGDAAYEHFRVEKMGCAKVRDPETKKLIADRTTIVYNSRISLSGIPEHAYRYMLGSRSAIEWIIDRYQVKTDKASGIVNDPNDWSREVSDPRYIIDLLARIVTVSLETMRIVDALPALEIREDSAYSVG